jgi:hypothetical protein
MTIPGWAAAGCAAAKAYGGSIHGIMNQIQLTGGKLLICYAVNY